MGNSETRAVRREDLVEKLADYILAQGLANASLRPLAAAAGTSDRMLLYYFRDKEDLVAATLGRIAERMKGMLEAALPQQVPAKVLLPLLRQLLRDPGVQPYMLLWMELAARSARGEEPFRSVAGAICDGFAVWTASRLAVRREADRESEAALLFCLVEGMLVFDSVGRGTLSEAAVEGFAGGGRVGRRKDG